MLDIFVTATVFQEPIGWLKAAALWNMLSIETLPVVLIVQLLISAEPPLLNAVALINIC